MKRHEIKINIFIHFRLSCHFDKSVRYQWNAIVNDQSKKKEKRENELKFTLSQGSWKWNETQKEEEEKIMTSKYNQFYSPNKVIRMSIGIFDDIIFVLLTAWKMLKSVQSIKKEDS